METLSVESCSIVHLQQCRYSGLQKGRRIRKESMLITSNWRRYNKQLSQSCSAQALSTKRYLEQVKLPTSSILCSPFNGGCTVSDTETCENEEALILKRKAEEISFGLDGKTIFLVGMMGSGKSTVGKILSEALGYYFFDSDHLIEEAAGGTPVAQIFRDKNEEYFRDAESKVLSQLSTMHRLVVATGGGAVVRPQNWDYLNHGVSVWLDVPLDALARRIAAVGTESRPLLGQASVDPYSQALAKLQQLIIKRGKAYGNSNARVCLQKIAEDHGSLDVLDLTPTMIAFEVLKEISNFLSSKIVNGGISNAEPSIYKYTRKF